MDDKFVIVTGAPRTGTSLMIRILKEFGIPPVAKSFLWRHFCIRKFNPNGFYDSTITQVLTTRPRRAAMKVWGGMLSLLRQHSYSHIIYCGRRPSAGVASSERVLRHLRFPGRLARAIAEFVWTENALAALSFIDSTLPKVCYVNLEYLRRYPYTELSALWCFLGFDGSCGCADEPLASAAALVKPWVDSGGE